MRQSIKRLLKESYEKQYLKKLCNVLSAGNNHKSIEFIEKTVHDLLNLNLSEENKNKIKDLYYKWKRDIKSNNKDLTYRNGIRSATPDSEGDISNIYLSQIQDILCPIFMEMD